MVVLPGQLGLVLPVRLVIEVLILILIGRGRAVVRAAANVVGAQAVLAITRGVVMSIGLQALDTGLDVVPDWTGIGEVAAEPVHVVAVVAHVKAQGVQDTEDVIHVVGHFLGDDVVGEIVGSPVLLGTQQACNAARRLPKDVIDIAHIDVEAAHGLIGVVHDARISEVDAQADLIVLHKAEPERLHVLLQRVVGEDVRCPGLGEEEALKAGERNGVQDLLRQAKVVRQLVEADQVHLVLGVGTEAHWAHQVEVLGTKRILGKVHQLLQEPGHVLGRHGDTRETQEIQHLLRTRCLRQRLHHGTGGKDLHGKEGKEYGTGKEGNAVAANGVSRGLCGANIPHSPPPRFNFSDTSRYRYRYLEGIRDPRTMSEAWKYLGIYKAGTQAIYVCFKDKGILTGYQNGKEIAINPTESGISYNHLLYERWRGVGNPDQAFRTAKRLEHRGTTGRIVLASKQYIFKTTDRKHDDMDRICEESSRTLGILAKGVPHAEWYGIVENRGVFYMVEERLDTERFSRDVAAIKECMRQLPTTSQILHPPGYSLLVRYILDFQHLIQLLQEADVGGDFKLDNMGYREETRQLVLTDLSIPYRRQRYRSLSWNEWVLTIPKTDLDAYLNPVSRLVFKEA
jgi:hypothetical protein